MNNHKLLTISSQDRVSSSLSASNYTLNLSYSIKGYNNVELLDVYLPPSLYNQVSLASFIPPLYYIRISELGSYGINSKGTTFTFQSPVSHILNQGSLNPSITHGPQYIQQVRLTREIDITNLSISLLNHDGSPVSLGTNEWGMTLRFF